MAHIYLSEKLLANIKIGPGSNEEALQFDYRKKGIGPEMMSQKIIHHASVTMCENRPYHFCPGCQALPTAYANMRLISHEKIPN
jgi:hypothetical protein